MLLFLGKNISALMKRQPEFATLHFEHVWNAKSSCFDCHTKSWMNLS